MHNENLQISSSNHPKKPVLSLILCSRNDRYMGNPRWRLQTALIYLAQNIHELGREEDVEVIVADWESKIPLRDVLRLSGGARCQQPPHNSFKGKYCGEKALITGITWQDGSYLLALLQAKGSEVHGGAGAGMECSNPNNRTGRT